MYKNKCLTLKQSRLFYVSILVLMELCIKTLHRFLWRDSEREVSILVLMELCIKTDPDAVAVYKTLLFQSLF